MSESDERQTSTQESRTAEEETKSEQDEVTKSSKKRDLDSEDEDEDSENGSYMLKYEIKKRKPTARRIADDFEKTEDDYDSLPLDCPLCLKSFFDPVVTICHHFFCKQCALKHYANNVKCFVCNEPTLGDFKTAVGIKKRIAQEREKARAMVHEVSEMLGRALTLATDAGDVAAKAVKMVEEVETMVATTAALATKAGETAAKAAEMVQESGATMEKGRANMAKAVAGLKTVVWTV